MDPIRFAPFSGIAPKVAARQLPAAMAQIAASCRLFSGELGVWRATKKIGTASKGVGVKSIFRMVDAAGAYIWLNWLEDVNAVRGPIAGDTTQRTYYTGQNEPRVTDLALASASSDYPFDCYVLGVFPPATAPSVSHSGGAGAAISRAFRYTYVTEWGEESQPSPASSVTAGKVDGTWALSGMNGAWPNTFTVTGGTWASGTATLTVASTYGLRVGETITVTSVTPSAYNALKVKITALTATTVSYALSANPGAWSSGGSIARVAKHHTTGLRKRIYWTETVAGVTVFQFVAEIDGTLTSTSVAGNATVGEPIASTAYEMPPTDMRGLVEMPNGMMAAFRENEIYFCEPFKPHAWPSMYRLTTFRAIVGLGVLDQSIVACTNGTPHVASGTHPDSMSEMKVNGMWPCASKRGIVSMRDGVLYPSRDGWVLVSSSGSGVVSASVLERREFERYFPMTMFAAPYQERYFAFYYEDANTVKGVIFDRTGDAMLVPLSLAPSAVWTDPETGILYLVEAGLIREWDADDTSNLTYDWKSKVFVLASPKNYAAAKVQADFSTVLAGAVLAKQDNEQYLANVALLASSESWPAQGKISGCLNESMLGAQGFEVHGSRLLHGALKAGQLSESNRFLNFYLYSDGALVFTKSVTNQKPFRLPSGFKSREIEVRLTGNVETRYAEIAGSMQSLGRV